MPELNSRYRGRFAPSPSGPLHFGSLVAAVGSYLQAKSQQGDWLVRLEDIDQPRMVKGAADAILRSLELYGLHWDGDVWVQSQRLERYQQVLNQLSQQQLVYGCDCPRARTSQLAQGYDGHCRQRLLSQGSLAYRLKVPPTATEFTDLLQGQTLVPAALAQEDYILKRRDGLFAYQLVVVVDDIDQGITQVVRGADLIDVTTRQQALFTLLGAQAPSYLHLPLAVKEPGFKLSKQNHAPAISDWPISQTLSTALSFLGHPPPSELKGAPVHTLLHWAVCHWDLAAVPAVRELPLTMTLPAL
ncbi:tRNA glutamyl-Q(34) synthetase GluQRS [Rheinheimera sp.]|uniref:tRNA glutamyl-Q(34) synthetase GluQRS n=1 Tax=Rheinheimera sp. TaxID=1869214 RepID=UPI00307D059A